MKHFALAATLLPGLALATPTGHPIGPNLTYGDISINHNILSNVTNPAFGATMLKPNDNDYRIGLMNFGLFFEVGQVDNIVDEADTAGSALEQTITASSFTINNTSGAFTVTPSSGSAITLDSVATINNSITSMQADGYDGDEANFQTELETRIVTSLTAEVNAAANSLAESLINDINSSINPTVASLNDDGYMKMGLSAQLPLSPFVVTHKMLKGSLEVHANISIQGRADYISSYVKPAAIVDIVLDKTGTSATNPNNWQVSTLTPSFEIETDAAAVIKTAAIQEFGVGYSREVLQHEKGKLYAGGRLNMYRVGLSKSYIGMKGSDEIDQVLEDQLDASQDMSSGFGLDFGAMWIAENYRLGATVNNINAPTFDYNNVSDCSNFSNFVDTNNPANNITSATLADCTGNNSYTMDPQLKLEAVTSAWDDKVTLGFGYDVNPVEDAFGQEYKWLTLSAGANLGNWVAIRGGYRDNQGKEGLSFYTAGLTLFTINIDVGMSQDSIEIDGESAPRSLYASLGWGLNF